MTERIQELIVALQETEKMKDKIPDAFIVEMLSGILCGIKESYHIHEDKDGKQEVCKVFLNGTHQLLNLIYARGYIDGQKDMIQ